MPYGFETYKNGILAFSSLEFSVMILDTITVAPTDTGSQNYTGLFGNNIKVTQTQELDVSLDKNGILPFNVMDIGVTDNGGGSFTVDWSPGVSMNGAKSVTLFVLVY